VLLLDEPLSALDAQVRAQIREEIRRIQLELGITTLFVTHDQEEAMAISDRVGVMNQGKLEQIDSPTAIYNSPATPFVASFVGQANRLPAEISGGGNVRVLEQKIPLSPLSSTLEKSKKAIALIRPEALAITSAEDVEAAFGIIAVKSFLGPITKLGIAAEGLPLIHLNLASKDARKLDVGQAVAFKIIAEEVMVESA
jgi:putative spermidine/putrescine transport system ATP-binding protein